MIKQNFLCTLCKGFFLQAIPRHGMTLLCIGDSFISLPKYSVYKLLVNIFDNKAKILTFCGYLETVKYI